MKGYEETRIRFFPVPFHHYRLGAWDSRKKIFPLPILEAVVEATDCGSNGIWTQTSSTPLTHRSVNACSMSFCSDD